MLYDDYIDNKMDKWNCRNDGRCQRCGTAEFEWDIYVGRDEQICGDCE